MVSVALGNTAALAAGGGETAELPVLHDSLTDPVDARVVADDAVRRVHEDDLEELVASVDSNPVGVEHAQVTAALAHALLSHRAERAGELDAVDGAGLAGLAVDDTLAHRPLAGSTAHAHAVDNVALLGLVSQPIAHRMPVRSLAVSQSDA